MRAVLGLLITLMALLGSGSWSSSTPTCYEPTSGYGPPLLAHSCTKTGMMLIDDYPLDSYLLIHETPPNPKFISCPLKIEKDGCLFTLDYFSATSVVRIERKAIVNSILQILVSCIGHGQNADGGQIVDNMGNHIWIKYTLQHPEKLARNNTASFGDTQLNENLASPTLFNASISGDSKSNLMVPSK